MRSVLLLSLLTLLCACERTMTPGASVHPTVDGERITLELGPGVQVDFITYKGYLLGLHSARVQGQGLSDGTTVLRPWLTQEHQENKRIWPLMRLRSIKDDGDGKVLELDLFSTTQEEAFRDFFVFSGDRQAALKGDLPKELKALKS